MRFLTGLVVTAAVCAGGCAAMQPAGPKAVATLEPRSGSTVSGRVEFRQSSSGVHLHVELAGLKPGSEHGFHVHDKGDCSAPDAMSTGGHFNPAGAPHGRAGGAAHHAGDLPSLTADAAGKVRVDLDVAGLTLDPGPTSIVGRSVVVHGDRDDFTTQPGGNSGARVACGVIGAK
ncbi:MAG TPA: superoxide dismutase family protein [Steroidobacteraceae bacterium]|nr:superoxide dismutase family protein [Steroidobacteraceae bacterium]